MTHSAQSEHGDKANEVVEQHPTIAMEGRTSDAAMRHKGESGHNAGTTKAHSGGSKDGRRSPTALADAVVNVATPSRGGRANRELAKSGGNSGGDKARGPANGLEDLMRRKGVDEAWCTLEERQRQGITTDKYTVSRMLMKTVRDGRVWLDKSRVYRGISLVERFIEMQPKDVDEVLFNALLDTCSRLKDLTRLEATVNRMCELEVQPSPVTFGILVKTYGQAEDFQKVLQVWGEMERQQCQANAVTYGCMIDACVKCGHLEKAVEIFKDLRKAGKHRNTILYTTLIKGYGLEKDLNSALELFREMPGEDVPYNAITYNSILDACIKCNALSTAESLLREMMAPDSSLEPDLITFSTLLKGYCNVADLDKAMQVAEAIKARGLRCDELVYNTLMDGCVKANDITAGIGLFEEMVQSGMRPSAITHSILATLYHRAGYEDDATEAVDKLYQHHGIERPSRNDRGKGAGRKWNPRSPNGRGSGKASLLGSPSEASVTSADPSAPSTPRTSPMHGGKPYLPVETLRGPYGTSMLGMGHTDTPFGSASCTSAGSWPPFSFADSVNGSPCIDGSPCLASPHQGMFPQSSFNMQTLPSMLQSGFGPGSGTPMTTPAMQVSQLSPMPFACPGQFASPSAEPPLGNPAGSEVGMQQAQMQQHLIAVSLMQQAVGNGAMQSTIASNGAFSTFGNNGGQIENSAENTCAPQLLQLAAMAAAASGMPQQAPFTMPMQDPQLAAASYGTAPGGQPQQRQHPQQQAYFEGWPGGRGQQQAQQLQQMGTGMQMMNGGMQAMQMGTSVGQATHGGQFFP